MANATAVTAESDDADAKRKTEIGKEFQRLEESAKDSAQNQFEQTKFWRRINFVLGIPASVLAGVAGATALASTTGRLVAGILALLAAGFGAMLTTVNASRRMNQASAAANAYLEIQTAARQARLIDLPVLSSDDARQQLAELTARRDEQNKTADPPGRRIYRRAQRNIIEGGQTYDVDEPLRSDEQND